MYLLIKYQDQEKSINILFRYLVDFLSFIILTFNLETSLLIKKERIYRVEV